MKSGALRVYLTGALFASALAAAGGRDAEIQKLAQFAGEALAVRPELALTACVQAIRLDSSNTAAQDCMKKVKAANAIDLTLAAAAAAQVAGRLDDGRVWCDAALFADPGKSNAKCVEINKSWVTHRQQTVQLQQAAAKLQQHNLPEAETILKPLRGSDFPDILNRALALSAQAALAAQPPDLQLGTQYVALRMADEAKAKCTAALTANPVDPNALQCLQQAMALKQDTDDQKSWSTIAIAKAQNADGKRDAAVQTLNTLLAQPNLSPAVRISAGQALTQTRTTSFTVLGDALKSQWIIQFVAALTIVAALWIVPHILRWVWRRIYGSLWARLRPIQWAYTGVQDDGKIGASDAVLDALRRVPNLVMQAIWTPGRLLLHATAQGFEVWEDFGITELPQPLHESIWSLPLDQGRVADNTLADAFQNLQFNVGGVGLNVATRFWRAILDWWRDGQPAFFGVAQDAPTLDGAGKQVVIRLTCSGGPYGTASVLASTKREDNVDAVAMTASRAAYKLLSRMSPKPETIEQIDGHAAFRQGAKVLACYVKSFSDTQADQTRTADLSKAVVNLEFARQVFCRDATHVIYYLEALRFEAVAYALLGRTTAAITRFEELEDKASTQQSRLGHLLAAEAAYNQGALHLTVAAAGTNTAVELQLARQLFASAQTAAGQGPLADVAAARSAAVLAAIPRGTWSELDPDAYQSILNSAGALIEAFDAGAASSKGAERRAYSVLSSEARRDFAIARLRYLAAFVLPARGPFETGAPAPTNDIIALLQECLEWFAKFDEFGSATLNVLVCRAHALLLSGKKWQPAEYYAERALALDKTCELACYVAAEACLQRGDRAAAQQYLTNFAPTPITDPALSRLHQALNPTAATATAGGD